MSRWYSKVAIVLCVFFVAGVWALTPIGFARAADLQSKISEALEPVKKEQADLKQQVASMKVVQERDSRRLALSIANGVASEIRLLRSKICKTALADDKDRLWREIERKQDEYSELRGTQYNVPSCAEL